MFVAYKRTVQGVNINSCSMEHKRFLMLPLILVTCLVCQTSVCRVHFHLFQISGFFSASSCTSRKKDDASIASHNYSMKLSCGCTDCVTTVIAQD